MRVSGSDKALYPPMSDQLAAADITVYEGFDPAQLNPAPDLVVIGNAQLPRGHAGIEYVLEKGLPYTSGAEWLGRQILQRPLGARRIGHARQNHDGEHARAHSRSRRSESRFPDRRRAEGLRRIGASRQPAVLRSRSRRIRHFVFRPPVEVRALPAAHARHQQSRVRPRRHISGSRRHSDPVPSSAAHGSVERIDRRAGARRSGRSGASYGMLDAGGSRSRQPTTAQSREGCHRQRRTVEDEERVVRRFAASRRS